MVTLTNILKYIAVGAVLPYLLGMKLSAKQTENTETPMSCVFHGYIVMWAAMQLVAIPMIFLKLSFRNFVVLCSVIFLLIALWNAVTERKNQVLFWKKQFAEIKKKKILWWILAALVLLQGLYVAASYMSNDDDAYYVATAQTALDTNSMYAIDPYTGDAFAEFPARYVLSPFPLFVAFFSQAVGVKAPVMAHTLLPFFLIIFVYVIYRMWAEKLFPQEEKKQTLFFLFVMLILAYSNFSTHAKTMMMFPRIWQGKAVLATILLPYILLPGTQMILGKMRKTDWINLFLTMTASCLVSSMGIMLAAIEIGICGLMAMIRKKNMRPLFLTALCCMPNVIYAGIYLMIR